jgi:4,5-DOPA dioxygenase extradiol
VAENLSTTKQVDEVTKYKTEVGTRDSDSVFMNISECAMRFPAVFVNHGGGPLPLLGRQPELVEHMKEVRTKWLPQRKPDAIVVLSAHWESDPIQILASPNPSMLYDYSGFPPETYKYEYPAPGSPELANKIKNLLDKNGLKSELNDQRGFDHGVFIPLMIMYPEADIPVVAVSLHSSLSADINIQIGKALEPLRDENILLLGSGYTFHNMHGFFHPSEKTYKASTDFNAWLKDAITNESGNAILEKLEAWEKAPGARISHPREEHLIPLFMVAAAASGSEATPEVILDTRAGNGEHAISSYLFP